ncbi:MAG: hypothetical protein HN646_08250 [Nitrospina sp.]|jgi:uncharacterized membrane protein YbhN (UPF0104 family)|nr:hypothetical protein [Nitrospina sp.]
MTRCRKRVLLAGSVILVIIVSIASILIYPKKRDDINLTNQELLAIIMKVNKTHEDNIAILDEFRSKRTLSQSKVKTQKILKEVKASLAFSIIQHQIEYNENKKKSLYLIFYGMGALLIIWGFLILIPNKTN